MGTTLTRPGMQIFKYLIVFSVSLDFSTTLEMTEKALEMTEKALGMTKRRTIWQKVSGGSL